MCLTFLIYFFMFIVYIFIIFVLFFIFEHFFVMGSRLKKNLDGFQIKAEFTNRM